MPVALPPDARRNAPANGTTSELSLFRQKVRAAAQSGQVRFLPWIDRYTRETPEMRATYREMLKSPVVKAALWGKVVPVAALPLQSHPEDDTPRAKEVADSTRDGILACDGGLLKIAESVLLPACLGGCSISQKWLDPMPRGKWRGKYGYSRLQPLDTDAGPRVRPVTDEHLKIVGVQPLAYNDQQIWPAKDFVILSYQGLFDNPLGTSDFRAAYAAYWRLDTVEKLRVIHLEKWTSPFLKGTYPAGMSELKDDLEDALEQAKSNTWIVLPDGVQIEAMQIAMRGEAEFQAAVADYKEEIALAIAGAFLQMLTSRGGGGDMRGDAATQQGTAELFVWYLAELLAQTITKQMGPDLVDLNYVGAGYPTFTLGSVNDSDLLSSAQLDEILQRLGMPLSRKERASYYGRQLAADEEDILKPAQPAQQPGVGGGLPFADPEGEQRDPFEVDAFCQTGVNAGKPGPCPSGVHDQPVAHETIAATAAHLNETEKEALKHYTEEGHETINKALRATKGKLTGALKQQAQVLDNAIAKAPKLPEPITVQRGMDIAAADLPKFIADMDRAAKTGKPITNYGYTSTTLDPDVVEREFGIAPSEDRVVVRFEIKARHGVYAEQITGNTGEEEFLIGRGAKFKVGLKTTEIKHGKPETTYHLEQVT